MYIMLLIWTSDVKSQGIYFGSYFDVSQYDLDE